ncbi:helix-turn-helix domain-containing protein [Embleya sp. AB8]|uniref:helix-turn-helix domain-containing protein n=1 Tax=Embleya sp. AB8 TaxID=3156304 RepID=UPI003C78B434
MPELRLALLAGTEGLGREVCRVVAADPIDPDGALTGGELVVATGDPNEAGPDGANFVRSLTAGGATALVIAPRAVETPPRIRSAPRPPEAAPTTPDPVPDAVPYALVDACTRAGLPLLLAPPSVSPIRITEVIAGRIATEHEPATGHLPTRQRRLIAALAEGADTQALLDLLAHELGTRCRVITPAGGVLAAANPADASAAEAHRPGPGHDTDRGTRTAPAEADPRHPAPGGTNGPGSKPSSGDATRTIRPVPDCVRLARDALAAERLPALIGGDTVFALGRGAAFAGYLVCGGDRRADRALAQCADLLLLGGARHAERSAVQRAHAWELVELIEADAAPAAIRARLGAAGIGPDAAPIVICAAGDGADAWTERLVVDLIEQTLAAEPAARWVVACGKAEVVVLGAGGSGAGAAARIAEALARTARWWEQLLGPERVAIGIAGTSPTWVTALAEARGARDLAWTRPGRLTVAESPEIDAYPALLTAVPAPVRAAFADRVLGGLRAYDAEHGTDLVGTLAAFLAANGAWQRCAGMLGVHVSALHQRMGRVRDLTGRDLFSARDRVDLLLALETDPSG